jgi:hypothetical protein
VDEAPRPPAVIWLLAVAGECCDVEGEAAKEHLDDGLAARDEVRVSAGECGYPLVTGVELEAVDEDNSLQELDTLDVGGSTGDETPHLETCEAAGAERLVTRDGEVLAAEVLPDREVEGEGHV